MSFKPYPIHKQTGVEWLGPIPEHWRIKPFWALYRRIKRGGFPGEELLSVYRDYGVIRKSDRDDNFNNPSEDLSTYQLVEPGDLAMNKMKAWQGSLGVSSLRGIVSPAYFVFRAVHNEVDRYLHYLLRSPPFAAGFMTISKGIRINQWDIDPDHLSQVPVPLPSIDEQRAIIAFLDRETGKIDALVEEQRRLIELLREKRQAVISHAVTKGLDPSAPMKDSGVEWLGEVPAHWDVARLQDQAAFFQGKAHEPYVDDAGEHICVTARFVSTDGAAIKTCTTNLSPAQVGDILMVMSDLPNGRALARTYLVEDNRSYAVNQRVCCVRFSHGSPAYFAYQLNRSKQLLQFNDGVEQTHLTNGAFTKMRLAIPPVEEQHAIARYLNREIGNLEDLAVAADHATSLLIERRAALISAAVTGKIDVRHVDAGRRAA